MARTGALTPMLRQYLEIKEEYPDALLFYRMGDFYELFFEDAERAAPILEVALTARNKGSENEAPMCGVPHHAVDTYIGKVLKAGMRVAICDQVEDPALAKGLVKREVTRVVSPGTVSEPTLLEGKEDNLLATVYWGDAGGAGAFLELSTGRFFVREWRDATSAREDLELFGPREILYPTTGEVPAEVLQWIEASGRCATPMENGRWFERRRAEQVVQDHFQVATSRGFGLSGGTAAIEAVAAAISYARGTQQSDLPHIRDLEVRASTDAVVLDPTTVENLEVFRNQRGGREHTLLATLDRTASAGGGRLLRDWLRRPLLKPEAIRRRLDAVEELLAAPERLHRLRGHLGQLGDPERLLARAVLGTLTPREAGALRDGLEQVPSILFELQECRSDLLAEVAKADPIAELQGALERTLVEQPPASFKEGGVIASGVDPELDEVRSLARNSKEHVLALERREREETGIGSLKIRFNRVFGYYIEVTKSNLDAVPERYVRKQTLAGAERFFTPELKDLEEQILQAEERSLAFEQQHFERLRLEIVEHDRAILALSRALATLDALAGFAAVAEQRDYRRPKIEDAGSPIEIEGGRHPVVEAVRGIEFIANDSTLDATDAQIVILTGPNMGGKSTYLRQVALIVLMGQTGSFVPAASASLGVVDRIFSRVGASDDLARGESTFMVEMIETSNILRTAGEHSLVILDEVGRGTATFDGLSLAWAIVEHLHERCGCKTLFATHYHELTELASLLPRVKNRKMAVKEWEDRIVFLHRVVPGSADKSYGLHVARLAGIPESVIARAGEILENLEGAEYDPAGRPRLAAGSIPESAGPDQMQLFAPPEQIVASILRDLDLERLAPLAALNLLHSLKSRLGD